MNNDGSPGAKQRVQLRLLLHVPLALEGELTAAINEKDSAAQWAQMCHRRAIGSEEAAVFARDDLRKLKQLTRAIRMGEMDAVGEKLDSVRASMRIEELDNDMERFDTGAAC